MRRIVQYLLGGLTAISAVGATASPLELDCNGNMKIRGVGVDTAAAVGAPEFPDGESVAIGAGKRFLVRHYGKLSPDSGTLELRLKPLDWYGDDNSHKYWFYSRQPKGNDIIQLRKNNDGRLLFFIGTLPGQLDQVFSDAADWQPGQWHTVKAVWDKEKLALFVDGRKVGETKRRYRELKFDELFWLGGTIWAPAAGDSAVDYLKLDTAADFSGSVAPEKPAAQAEFKPATDNILRPEFGAIMLPSSQFKPDKSKSAEMMFDGLAETWFVNEKDDPDCWVELRYPAPVTLRSVKVLPYETLAPRSYEVKSWQPEGGWRSIAQQSDVTAETVFEPVLTERLRLYFAPGPRAQIGIRELMASGAAPKKFLKEPTWKGGYLWAADQETPVALFRRTFRYNGSGQPRSALLQVSCDDAYELYCNGEKIGAGGFDIGRYDLAKFIRPGENVLAIRAENFSGPRGLLAEMTLIDDRGRSECLASDGGWTASAVADANWFKPEYSGRWAPAAPSLSLKDYARNMRYYSGASGADGGLDAIKLELPDVPAVPGGRVAGAVTFKAEKAPDGDCGFRFILGPEAVSDNADYAILAFDLMPAIPTARWEPGKEYRIPFEFYLPSWAPHGATPLRIRALGSGGEIPIRGLEQAQLKIKRFAADPVLRSQPVKAEVRNDHGAMRIYIDGRLMPPVIFSLNSSFTTYRELGEQAPIATGIYRFSPKDCSLFPPEGVDPEAYFTRMLSGMDQQIMEVLKFYPEAYLLLPLDCRINYATTRPEDAVLLSDGQKLMYSNSSERWLAAAIDGGTRIIEHLRKSPYAGHIMGVCITTGAGGETMHWGYTANPGNTPREQLALGDFSPPAQQRFREFLKQRYGSDVEKLRAAWRRPAVTFDQATVEIEELRKAEMMNFRNPANSRMAMDYWDFHSDASAAAVGRIAAAFKQASGDQWLIGAWGFYSLAIYPAIASRYPGALQQIAGMSLDKVLAEPAIDFLACIQSYSAVRGKMPLMTSMPTASMRRNGKLFIEEFDVRTFFVDLNHVADHHTTSRFETVNVMRRDFGESLVRGDNSWFCGFASGYAGRRSLGWFAEDSLIDNLNRFVRIGKAVSAVDNRSAAEIALFVNNRDIATLDVMTGAGVLYNTQHNTVYNELEKLGVPFDCYLLSDFSEATLKPYKMVVMLNAFFMDSARRREIREVLEKQGKTVLWLFAPGYADPETGLDGAHIAELTGIGVDVLPELRENPAIAVAADGFQSHTMQPIKQPHAVGALAVGPIFVVNDPAAKVLGVHQSDRKPALAFKAVGTLNSYYCALPFADEALLRDICHRAGVYFYTDVPLFLNANRSLLTIHAPQRIDTTLRLPRRATVLDLYANRLVATEAAEFPLKLEAGESALYFFGTAEAAAALSRQLAQP